MIENDKQILACQTLNRQNRYTYHTIRPIGRFFKKSISLYTGGEYDEKGVIFSLLAVSTFFITFTGCDFAFDFNDVKNPTNKYVAVIGDSIFDLSGKLQQYLAELSGETYEDWTRSGEKISGIAKQYDKAIYENPDLRTIIMDGGGNDVLQGNQDKCASYGELPGECEELLDWVVDVSEDMFENMFTDGIDDLVFLGYYNLPNDMAKLNVALNYAMDEIKWSCSSANVDCYFVDPRPEFENKLDAYVKSDNIHPTDPGSEVLAEMIWDTMIENKIEQNQEPGGGDDDDDDDDTGSGGCG